MALYKINSIIAFPLSTSYCYLPRKVIHLNVIYRTGIFLYVYINVNYVCSIDHYTFGGSHASDIITCLNGSLLGITNHI